MNTKVKLIVNLIESLNKDELKQLSKLMEAPFPEDSEYGSSLKIEELSVEEIATRIENGTILETKEVLMKQNKYGRSVAHELARYSYKTGWYTDDKDVLMLQNKYGESVAHYLAHWSNKTGWYTDDKDVLMLQNDDGETVEDILIKRDKI